MSSSFSAMAPAGAVINSNVFLVFGDGSGGNGSGNSGVVYHRALVNGSASSAFAKTGSAKTSTSTPTSRFFVVFIVLYL